MRVSRLRWGGWALTGLLAGSGCLSAPQTKRPERPKGAAAPVSLKSSWAEARLKGLVPGRTVSLIRQSRRPLRVTYVGARDMIVRIEPQRPAPGELTPGYEAIPDPSWIRIEKPATLARAPGAVVRTDIFVSVPPGHRGRSYQARIRIFLEPSEGLSAPVTLALECRLLFSVAGGA